MSETIKVVLLTILIVSVGGAAGTCVHVENNDMMEYSCVGGQPADLNSIPVSAEKIRITKMPLRRITADTFSRFGSNLWVLACSHCEIVDIDPNAFKRLVNLQQLSLDSNHITTVKGAWFEGLDSLTYLDLNYNNIDQIEDEVYKNLPDLVDFRISGNRLQCVNLEAMSHLQELKRMFLSENPDFKCPNAVSSFLENRGVNFEKDPEWSKIPNDLIRVDIPPQHPTDDRRTSPSAGTTMQPYRERLTTTARPPYIPPYYTTGAPVTSPEHRTQLTVEYRTRPPDEYRTRPPVDYRTQPSVDYTTQPSVDYRTHPSVDYRTHPSVDYRTHPSVDYRTHPSVDYRTHPSVDYRTQPSVDYRTHPSVDYRTHPSVDYRTHPSVDYRTHPSVDYRTHPSVDYRTHPSVDYRTHPSVDHRTHPSVDYRTRPSVEQSNHPDEHTTRPSEEHTTRPSTESYTPMVAVRYDVPLIEMATNAKSWPAVTESNVIGGSEGPRYPASENEYHPYRHYPNEATRPPLLASSPTDQTRTAYFTEANVDRPTEMPRAYWTPGTNEYYTEMNYEDESSDYSAHPMESTTTMKTHVVRPYVPSVPHTVQPASPDNFYQGPYYEPTVTVRPPPLENYQHRSNVDATGMSPMETTTDKPFPECPGSSSISNVRSLELLVISMLLVVLENIIVVGF